MNSKNIVVVGGMAILGAGLMTGCSWVSNPADMMAIHYEDGVTSSKQFKNCVPQSKRETNGPGDKYYQYPMGQRTFDFTGDKGSESNPINITAKGNDGTGSAQMGVPGVVAFNLTGTCDELRQFHERIGLKYKAWWGGSDFVDTDENKSQTPDGWEQMLRFYMGNAVKNVTQNVGSTYSYADLRGDASIRLEYQNKVDKALPAELNRLLGADKGDYFLNLTVTFNQPTLVDKTLDETIAKQQSAIAESQSKKTKAEADVKAAEAEVAVKKAEALKQAAEIEPFGSAEEYNKFKAIEQGLNPYQPQGTVVTTDK